MILYSVISSLFLLLIFDVSQTRAGECCSSHTDMFHRYHVQKWCPVFCCGEPSVGLTCCSDYKARAPRYFTDDFCASWFFSSQNIWIPILIGVVILAIIISSCICCVRVCFF